MVSRTYIVDTFFICSGILLLTLMKGVYAGLRQGFSTTLGSQDRSRSDEAGMRNGLSREMFLMKNKQWELQPVNFECIKDLKLRRHCQKYLSRPIKMKLSARGGKYGLRAQGLCGGKRLRGFWRQNVPDEKRDDFLKIGYDEACSQRLSSIEFEVILPPTDKKSRKLPSVIYSVVVETGSMNQKAIVPRSSGTVRILPEGRGNGEDDKILSIGKAFVTLPMRSGIIDPGWSRGRSFFKKGRTTGLV